jgi:hypothetical protein
MYYAVFLDDYLKVKDYFEWQELGRAYLSVILKYDNVPDIDHVELTEDEAYAFIFSEIPEGYSKITVRENTHIWDRLQDKPLEKSPQLDRMGNVMEGVFKYKYTVTEEDLENAASLNKKIAQWIPYGETN